MQTPIDDIHGKAILDYWKNGETEPLIIHNNYGTPEEMPVEVFFREEEDFDSLEQLALEASEGTILDIGAGAGTHSLVLQSRMAKVTALENSPLCIQVLQELGLKQVVFEGLEAHQDTYDTILVLMNGLGLAGTLEGVKPFLKKCLALLNPGGHLLIDSSDISYLYEDGLPKPDGYFGEVKYQYEYKGEKGPWFDWVYVDSKTLQGITDEMGVQMQVLHTNENDQYLARVTL